MEDAREGAQECFGQGVYDSHSPPLTIGGARAAQLFLFFFPGGNDSPGKHIVKVHQKEPAGQD